MIDKIGPKSHITLQNLDNATPIKGARYEKGFHDRTSNKAGRCGRDTLKEASRSTRTTSLTHERSLTHVTKPGALSRLVHTTKAQAYKKANTITQIASQHIHSEQEVAENTINPSTVLLTKSISKKGFEGVKHPKHAKTLNGRVSSFTSNSEIRHLNRLANHLLKGS